MEKKSFLMYLDYDELLEDLSDEELGQLMRAIFEYEKEGSEPNFKGLLKMAFAFIKAKLEEDKEKAKIGKYHWNWKGGITQENHSIRNSARYKKWRNDVFERDRYTCQICGKIGGKLNAHHIELFSLNKLKRFDLENGITYCEKCHRKVHQNER